MSISLFRFVLLYIVSFFIFVVWIVDEVTNFDIVKVWKTARYFFVTIVFIPVTVFLVYSYKTQYLTNVAYIFLFPKSDNTLNVKTAVVLPRLVKKIQVPEVSAKSIVISDSNKNKILFDKQGSQRLAPASTAKLVTALVALDLYKLDELLRVSKECTQVDSTKIFLPEGQIFLVKDLIYGMLIGSAGDAACVLSTSKVNYGEFVKLMNQKAKSIGMNDTQLSNPVGLDGFNGENFSTALDLYKLSNEVMKNPLLKSIVGSKKFVLGSMDKKFSTIVYTTNVLLWEMPQAIGIKTGTTEGAGEVLIFDYADEEKDLKIIVMGSQDRFSDTRVLLNWILNSYSWKNV